VLDTQPPRHTHIVAEKACETHTDTHNDEEKKLKHEYLHSAQDGSCLKHLGIVWYILLVVFVCIYTNSKPRGRQGLQRFSNAAEFLDIFLWRQILAEVAATHELRIKDTTMK